MASTSIISQQSDDPFQKIPTGNDGKSFMIVNTLTGEIVQDEHHPTNNHNYFGGERKEFGSQGSYYKPTSYNKEVTAFEELFKPANESKSEQIAIDLDFEIGKDNIWQLDNKFIVLNLKKKLLIIDQNKASQRIIYEQIKHRFLDGKSGRQKLMFPIEMDLNNKGIQVINDIEDYLRAIGFDFSISGNCLSIQATPPELPENIGANVINDIIETFEQLNILRMGAIQDNLAAAYSLNTSIKAGYSLRTDEMISIIKNLFKCSMPNLSPRGKKCFVYVETDQIENLFN
jgi:DNA mismatch repair protein MutL